MADVSAQEENVPRPTEYEQRRRRQAFWRLLAETRSVKSAVIGSGIEPVRAVAILDSPEGLSAALQLVTREAA